MANFFAKRSDSFSRLQPGLSAADADARHRRPRGFPSSANRRLAKTCPIAENCTLDAVYEGKPIRLHIKRYRQSRGFDIPADDEVKGIMALNRSH